MNKFKTTLLLLILFCSGFNLKAISENIFDYVKNGDLVKVDSVLSESPDVINMIDETNKTPLFWAVIKNNPEVLKLLIERGGDVNAKEVSKFVPLYYAARYGYPDCAKLLIKNGANTNELISGRYSLVSIACGVHGNGGSFELVKLLVENGVPVNDTNNSTISLRTAARKGSIDIVNYLLDKEATLPENNNQLNELLIYSVRGGMVNLYNKLVEAGVSLEINNENGLTLLHQASNSTTETDEIIKNLIKKGFEINIPDNYGFYPIHYAAESENKTIVECLIKNGADINIRNKAGKTAYNIAQEVNNEELLNLLVQYSCIKDSPIFPKMNGEYFGQDLSDTISQVFLPGIVNRNRNAHAVMVFSPDGKEAYWKLDGRILCSRMVHNEWTLPFYPSFSPKDVWCDVPFVSPDNSKIFFNSRKPVSNEAGDIKENIWYAERTETGWSEPKPLPEIVNKSQLHWQISVDLKGNIYFGARRADSKGGGDIYCSKFKNGEYQEPENIGDSINTGSSETCPFISPKGDYIIFTRIDRNASPRVSLYISYLLPDGKWSKSVNLCDYIPFKSYGLANYVSYDGKYIFYLDGFGGNNTVYWYSADFIEKLKPL